MTNTILDERAPHHSRAMRMAQIARIFTLVLILIPAILWADVSVRAPHASTTLAPGTPLTIEWTDDLETPRVTVELWDGQRQTTTVIAESVAAPQRSINWTVPDDMNSGTRYRVVVRDARRPHRALFCPGFYTVARLSPMATSTSELHLGVPELTVTPTPAVDRVMLSWIEPVVTIRVINTQGEEVRTICPTGEALTGSIGVEDLAPGSYSVQAQTLSQRVLRGRLVIYR